MQQSAFPMNDLKKLIREVPDFPKPGILPRAEATQERILALALGHN